MSNNTASAARADEVTETLETLEHLDPVTLLLDRNITERDADATLVASVREHGVLTPARGVRTQDGQVRLRYGYRRAAACMATGHLLPVIVAEVSGQAEDPEAAAAALDRLAEQWAENEHRAGLSATDKVSAVAQMSLLGLSSDQIATRTHTSPAYAAAAVTVARSEVARHALAKTPDLDLTQVAALAEFEDDLDAANRLYAAAQNGRFAHTLASERDARTRAEARTRVLAVLTERAVPVIDAPDYDAQAVRLNRIRHDGAMVTPAEHATCPGRAAFVESDWTTQDLPEGYDLSALSEEQPAPAEEDDGHQAPSPSSDEDDQDDQDDDDEEDGPTYRAAVRVWRVRWACTDPEAHGHTVPSRATTRPAATGSEEEQQAAAEAAKEAARAERREVRENNAAWRLAEPVRRDFIRTLLTRKTAPKGAAAFIATVAARHTTALTHHNASSVTADLLGSSALGGGYTAQAAPLMALGKASEARALVIALGTCLGACEAMTDVNDWRRQAGTTGLLLRTLTAWGYERSDVERLACGERPLAVEAAVAQADEADEADEADGDTEAA